MTTSTPDPLAALRATTVVAVLRAPTAEAGIRATDAPPSTSSGAWPITRSSGSTAMSSSQATAPTTTAQRSPRSAISGVAGSPAPRARAAVAMMPTMQPIPAISGGMKTA